MQFLNFNCNGRKRLGALLGNSVMDIHMACRAGGTPQDLPQDVVALLALGRTTIERIRELLETGRIPEGVCYPLDEVKLLAPVDHSSKIIGVAKNYKDWLSRAGMPAPKEPTLFAKLPNTVIGPSEPIVLPEAAAKVTYEAEVAVVIGSSGTDIPVSEAMSFVAGYTIINDISAVDVINHDGNMFRGKNFDTFAPLGPALVTPDEIPDPHNLAIRMNMNGRILQDSSTANMIMKIPELISYISRGFTLEPGDIIATGTPAGTAAHHDPPAFLTPGSEMEISIEGLGVLRNPVSSSLGKGKKRVLLS